MPLDPHLAAVLQSFAESGASPLHEGTPSESRVVYRTLTHGSLTPEQVTPVGSVEDAIVPGASGPLKARIYRPNGRGPFPTVTFFHGGGWVVGDLDTHDNMCRGLCRGSQSVVVSVDYRLAPEHRFPAAVEDAVEAAKWVAANALELGGSDVVALAGDSAGGNLAAVVAQELRRLEIPLAGQFLVYPSVDQPGAGHASMEENAHGYFLEKELMAWFYSHYVGNWKEPKNVRLAPIQAVSLASLPPAVIVTAEFDPLRDEGEAYGDALQAAGVYADVRRYAGMIHGFFDMGRWSPAAQQAIEESTQRFGEILRRL